MVHMPWGIKDESLIVLKGHLLVEDLMREYCFSKVNNGRYLEYSKMSFNQIAYLVRALQEKDAPSWIWGAIKKLNWLRNAFAHNLSPENYEKKRNEFIAVVKSENSIDILENRTEMHEILSAAIFVVFTALSANLHFKPKGLLELAMLLEKGDESSNKQRNSDSGAIAPPPVR
ncbi:MAG: hypothetical protein RPU13_01125 [Candidatus Sedimenticola sp. (ex Thyasira tokunagai)]